MNATATIFALALASNHDPEQHIQQAFEYLSQQGETAFSPIYLIPCRDGVGQDYWNAACLLSSPLAVDKMIKLLKEMEEKSGRIRPSHQISLDIDLIAWGNNLDEMQFNAKKWPLALDVKIPLSHLWQHPALIHTSEIEYPLVEFS